MTITMLTLNKYFSQESIFFQPAVDRAIHNRCDCNREDISNGFIFILLLNAYYLHIIGMISNSKESIRKLIL